MTDHVHLHSVLVIYHYYHHPQPSPPPTDPMPTPPPPARMPPRRNNSLSDATGAPHYVDEAWAILVGEKTECSL